MGMMNSIENQYDGNNDVAANKYGESVQVTWAEYDLMVALENLAASVDDLVVRVEKLEAENEDLRRAAGMSLE